MSKQHIVRVGLLGHVGRFTSVESTVFPRGARVICRTARGLEVGEVLAPIGSASAHGNSDGLLLRGVTPEDDLLLARLEMHKNRALEACQSMLAERGIGAALMDVEHLFDGQSLYFYFLGDVPPEVEGMTGELTQRYETIVGFRKFTETLTHGCGPGCGTDQAEGSGCGIACVLCSVPCSTGARAAGNR